MEACARSRAKCELPQCALGAISLHTLHTQSYICIYTFFFSTASRILLYFIHRDYCICYIQLQLFTQRRIRSGVRLQCAVFNLAHMANLRWGESVWRSRKWKLICCGTKSASNKVNGKWQKWRMAQCVHERISITQLRPGVGSCHEAKISYN